MCKIQNLIGLAAVSCALFSCTESEVTDHSEVNEHPAVASEWIKVNMGVGVEKGTSGEEGTESVHLLRWMKQTGPTRSTC